MVHPKMAWHRAQRKALDLVLSIVLIFSLSHVSPRSLGENTKYLDKCVKVGR